MSRAVVALVFAGGLVLGAAIDRSLLARSAKPAASITASEQPVVAASAPASTRELAACASTRDLLRAQLVKCVADTTEPEAHAPCAPCPPRPSMPGMTPDEEARVGQPESPVCKPLLAACEEGRNKVRTLLARCVNGGPEAVTSTPALTPEQEREALYRSYDVPILVRRVDGTTRVYRPEEWPPAGGVGEGNRVLATMGPGGLWQPLDGGR